MTPLILLTGGTGNVGRAAIPWLLRREPGAQIAVLTRTPERVLRHPRVVAIPGDLRYAVPPGLEARVTAILHCAADVRFSLPLDEARAANTLATGQLLAFALKCARLKRFGYVSTLYVAGRRAGRVEEKALRHTEGYFNTYEQSKHEAEALVLAQAKRLPVSIYRLSSVADTPRSHVWQAARLIPWSASIPFLPGDPDAPVDLIGVEWAAQALAALFCRFESGAVRHVCAGPERSLTVSSLLDELYRLFARDDQLRPGIRAPRLVSLSEFEHYRTANRHSGVAGRLLGGLSYFLPHLAVRQPFENLTTGALLRAEGIGPAEPLTALQRVPAGSG